MKAIQTRYVGPTKLCKRARITAFDLDGNKVTIPYPQELSGENVHRAAFAAFQEKYEWAKGNAINGAVKGGYVFVFCD